MWVTSIEARQKLREVKYNLTCNLWDQWSHPLERNFDKYKTYNMSKHFGVCSTCQTSGRYLILYET
jgi:hypothetical protein